MALPDTLNPALRLLLGVALLAGAVACAPLGMDDFDEPEVELLGIEPAAAGGMEARFVLRLRIVNPNSTPLEIDGLAYSVSIRDRKVLSGVSDEPISIGAYSEGTAELQVAAGMFSSMGLLRDLMASPVDGGLPYRLDAKISRKGLGPAMRISREGELNLGNP